MSLHYLGKYERQKSRRYTHAVLVDSQVKQVAERHNFFNVADL